MAAKKGGLGKGLGAIFAENDTEEGGGSLTLKLSDIEPNRGQPRKDFDDEALAELADSISKHGILQPLMVRPLPGGGYQIVAGERRWRAARMAGISEVPALVRELSDAEVMEIALIENLQREDLSPLEEALGYQNLMETYNMTQEDVSKTVGKSRPAVTNALRLLGLPQQARDFLADGKISAGHARALLSFPGEEAMLIAAKKVMEQGLSVRELESMAKKANAQPQMKLAGVKAAKKPRYFGEVEIALNEHLGRKVAVSGSKKKGVLQIEFYGEDDLAELMKIFKED